MRKVLRMRILWCKKSGELIFFTMLLFLRAWYHKNCISYIYLYLLIPLRVTRLPSRLYVYLLYFLAYLQSPSLFTLLFTCLVFYLTFYLIFYFIRLLSARLATPHTPRLLSLLFFSPFYPDILHISYACANGICIFLLDFLSMSFWIVLNNFSKFCAKFKNVKFFF